MADFKTQVEDLIGSVGDDALITQSLIDIGGEIIGALPNGKLISSSLAVAVSSSGLSISDKKILAVDKDDLPVRKIPANQKARYNDTASIYASTDTNPVYYIEAETIYVNGAAGSGATAGVLHYVPKLPTHNGSALISNGSDAVANFPLEAEYLLILGSSARCLQRLMADKSSSLSDLSISAVAPVVPESPSFTSPDISSTTLNNLGVPPIYTAPTTTISGVAWVTEYPSQASSITTAFTLLKAAVDQAETAANKFESSDESIFGDEDTFDTTASQLTRVKDALNNAENLIDNNTPSSSYDAYDLLSSEDLELLQGNLAIVQAELQRARAHIGEWVAIGDMRVKEVNVALSEAAGYANEIQTRLSATPLKISEFQSKVQDSLNEFNQANVDYQAKLQEAIQQAQLSAREAEQEANLKLQKEQSEYSSKLQKFQNELSEYQANVSKEVQEYTQNMSQYHLDYQWKQGQYGQLKAEYIKGLQILMGR
tara:strand:- start:27 stop:1481 length:1455 start_codon:yes stop_codon:yes gene_type:complete